MCSRIRSKGEYTLCPTACVGPCGCDSQCSSTDGDSEGYLSFTQGRIVPISYFNHERTCKPFTGQASWLSPEILRIFCGVRTPSMLKSLPARYRKQIQDAIHTCSRSKCEFATVPCPFYRSLQDCDSQCSSTGGNGERAPNIS